ncbi:hypothetical protein BDB00DRAFT_860183 [Zychaea mexicana]|uniref:uncharacterized protein n=1 Tax=Zychaea mexicana TaxID=64656 RepID=UPI0022FDDBCE|nr:uncharacterized protein BDB00DRAFT_860183 [Zychaea mexicana]KAI9474841.1 hypothetical protein BDB00DRAFT_860183 [Zychaea mexicana]
MFVFLFVSKHLLVKITIGLLLQVYIEPPIHTCCCYCSKRTADVCHCNRRNPLFIFSFSYDATSGYSTYAPTKHQRAVMSVFSTEGGWPA